MFDQQDSGCASYGVEIVTERWFVKSPTSAAAAAPSLPRGAPRDGDRTMTG
jgi:hypothetical protein